jgi:hypothetical protein
MSCHPLVQCTGLTPWNSQRMTKQISRTRRNWGQKVQRLVQSLKLVNSGLLLFSRQCSPWAGTLTIFAWENSLVGSEEKKSFFEKSNLKHDTLVFWIAKIYARWVNSSSIKWLMVITKPLLLYCCSLPPSWCKHCCLFLIYSCMHNQICIFNRFLQRSFLPKFHLRSPTL